MRDLQAGEHDLLRLLSPDSLLGAGVYLLIFLVLALVLSRVLRLGLGTAMGRHAAHIDRTTVSFLQQIGTAAVWVLMLILYAHLIPALRAMGTALLAGASVASVVIGLAAQSTLGNLVAGVAITLYRPFRLGDTLQVAAPSGTETGTVELISLGYTTLRTSDGRYVVLPNSVAASQVTVNLTHYGAMTPLRIVIRISRETELDAARETALRIARETAGADTPVSCVLTALEAASAVFELHLTPPAQADAAALRTRLITQLAKGFAAAGLDAPPERRASFS
ncbi:MAG TPA: mechanosensitive ion channel family protein [Steroidobacteraceae bacterium]|nr:mechanosensitive ion channel family protein [Steroidobacteraceae bacterium]